MRTKHENKDDWTCKSCTQKADTLYFVCPACMEDVRRSRIHKEREAQDE